MGRYRRAFHPQRVHFTEPFAQPPTVKTSIFLWDFDTDSGLRLDIWPEEIDTTGFNLVFRTWSDTRIARIRVTWQAFGQAREEEKSLKSA